MDAPVAMMPANDSTAAALLAAVGFVCVHHVRLDQSLQWLNMVLDGLAVGEALDAADHEESTVLRDRARRLALERLGEGSSFLMVQALVDRCARATRRRDELLRSASVQVLGSEETTYSGRTNERQSLQLVLDLRALAMEIQALVVEASDARLHGSLQDALEKRRSAAGD